MTSVDSGIETSNNSDDSSIAQNEDMLTDEINTVSSAVATISSTQNDIRDTKPENLRIEIGSDWLKCSPGVRLSLPSLVSINENYKYPEEIEHSTPTSSSGLIIPSSSVSYKFITPPPKYATLPKKSIVRRKIRAVHMSPRYNPVLWNGPRYSITERRMRAAAATNNTIMLKHLLDSGASPNNHDEQGRTPLHLASCRGYTEIVRLLLEHGADPNRRDCVGNIPLHLAAVTGKISVVTLLLNAGTDLLSLDQECYNPLKLARTKLKLLQNCKGEDMLRIREEVENVKSMLLGYLLKQKVIHKKMDTLSTFCSRLSLNNPPDQIQDNVKGLLANLDALSITQ
ncbi:ankyrin repeat domain-containing protein 54 [Megachile rotundata]|uniref:ankyrin repeat domain-containing protein 54 n=1 Tax=Megachile rotundata TaxID=143995 RepID=UPI000258F682|nr:PREDICTED: ankyrin repeat domain-containing protein 54-like [Megachile rotundata]